MDLGAFANITDLDKIMKENGIEVPRLRGLRLMKFEEPMPQKEIEKKALYNGLYNCEQACCSNFSYHPFAFEFSDRTRKLEKKYLIKDENGYETIGIRWNRVHGKKRKLFKYLLKDARRREYDMWNAFNKYCGREDVLYIHARIGGGNWAFFNGQETVVNQPWFLEKVDDAFDSTYCDIYAKIAPLENSPNEQASK